MAVDKAVQEKVKRQLETFVPVTLRAMFGGVGIYSEGTFFAMLTSDGILHFKVDDSNRADYEAHNMPQFINMPYYEVPQAVQEDPEQLRVWIEKALAVARAAKK